MTRKEKIGQAYRTSYNKLGQAKTSQNKPEQARSFNKYNKLEQVGQDMEGKISQNKSRTSQNKLEKARKSQNKLEKARKSQNKLEKARTNLEQARTSQKTLEQARKSQNKLEKARTSLEHALTSKNEQDRIWKGKYGRTCQGKRRK